MSITLRVMLYCGIVEWDALRTVELLNRRVSLLARCEIVVF